jgi:superkiller protein 3
MLGEAYVKSGRHTAGLKALEHVLELDPKNWMAMYHIADIHSQLGSYDKAIEAYEHILTITGDDQVGVTAALATAELAQGQQAAAGGFRERSRRAFHAALGLAYKVLQAGGHRPWAWKLIGDAAFELSAQEAIIADAEESSNALRPILEHLVKDDADRRSTVEGLGHAANLLQSGVDLAHTAKSAIFAYAYRAHLLKNEPRVIDSALYDLATSLHALSLKSAVESEEKTACSKAAISAIRLALERGAGDERLWNALGVLCEEGGAQLAQHAFVVSLELYQKVSPLSASNDVADE